MRLSAAMDAFFTLVSGTVKVRLGVLLIWWFTAALPPMPRSVSEIVSQPPSIRAGANS